ncbi:MAG: efflux RND transporter periplasmic adaptor subunit [Alphaproteobacteria bacterium]
MAKKRHAKIAVAVYGPCLVAALFASWSQLPATADELVVTAREVDDRKAVFATVRSIDVALARARIGGTVEALAVDEGSLVGAGDLLGRVVDPKLPLELAAVDARIRALESQRQLADLELKRIRSLRATGTASQARLEQAVAESDSASAALAAMRSERAVVAARLAEGDILAPQGGRVLRVHVTEKSVVTAGETIATLATEAYILRLELPERHARFFTVGDRVLVGARGMAEPAPEDRAALTEGRIRQVYPEIIQGRVIADATAPGLGQYFVGERVRVLVATGRRAAIVIPEDYLIIRDGLSYVRLNDGTETAVQTGFPADGGLEILTGLRPGDILVKP